MNCWFSEFHITYITSPSPLGVVNVRFHKLGVLMRLDISRNDSWQIYKLFFTATKNTRLHENFLGHRFQSMCKKINGCTKLKQQQFQTHNYTLHNLSCIKISLWFSKSTYKLSFKSRIQQTFRLKSNTNSRSHSMLSLLSFMNRIWHMNNWSLWSISSWITNYLAWQKDNYRFI